MTFKFQGNIIQVYLLLLLQTTRKVNISNRKMLFIDLRVLLLSHFSPFVWSVRTFAVTTYYRSLTARYFPSTLMSLLYVMLLTGMDFETILAKIHGGSSVRASPDGAVGGGLWYGCQVKSLCPTWPASSSSRRTSMKTTVRANVSVTFSFTCIRYFFTVPLFSVNV